MKPIVQIRADVQNAYATAWDARDQRIAAWFASAPNAKSSVESLLEKGIAAILPKAIVDAVDQLADFVEIRVPIAQMATAAWQKSTTLHNKVSAADVVHAMRMICEDAGVFTDREWAILKIGIESAPAEAQAPTIDEGPLGAPTTAPPATTAAASVGPALPIHVLLVYGPEADLIVALSGGHLDAVIEETDAAERSRLGGRRLAVHSAITARREAIRARTENVGTG
jgi:hypothetical protein